MPQILDDCYNWLVKQGPSKAIDARQIARNFLLANKEYAYTNIGVLEWSIEQDQRFDIYILQGNDETFTEDSIDDEEI